MQYRAGIFSPSPVSVKRRADKPRLLLKHHPKKARRYTRRPRSNGDFPSVRSYLSKQELNICNGQRRTRVPVIFHTGARVLLLSEKRFNKLFYNRMILIFLRADEADRPWYGILKLYKPHRKLEHPVVVYIYIDTDTELFGHVLVYQRALHSLYAYIRHKSEVTTAFCYIIETLVIFVKRYELLAFKVLYGQ